MERAGRRKAPAITSVLVTGGVIMLLTAIAGMVVNQSALLDSIYMDLSMTLPVFDYAFDNGKERGNPTFDAYVQMRQIAAGLIGAIMVYAGVARVMEHDDMGLVRTGTSNKVIGNAMIFMLIILIFPPLWDAGALLMNDTALWILNPDYSFDPEAPCPEDWYYDDSVILDNFNESPYRVGWEIDPRFTAGSPSRYADTIESAEFSCRPEFKVRYVFNQAIGSTSINNSDQGLTEQDPYQMIQDALLSFSHEVFVNFFLGLAKATISFTLLLLAFIVGVMADVMIGVVIAALPLMLFLSLLPKVNKITKRFLDVLPAFFLMPIMSAAVLVVGAGLVAEVGLDCAVRDTCEAVDDFAKSTDLASYAWMSALAVVFLAVMMPVVLSGMAGLSLKSAVSMADQQVRAGVHTGIMVSGMSASGLMGGGARGARQASRANDMSRSGMLGLVLGSAAGGLGHGLLQGTKGAKTSGFGGANAVPSTGKFAKDLQTSAMDQKGQAKADEAERKKNEDKKPDSDRKSTDEGTSPSDRDNE